MDGVSNNGIDEIIFEPKKEDPTRQTETTSTGAKVTTTNASNKAKTSNSQYASPTKLKPKVSKVLFRPYDLNYDLNVK